MTSEDPSDENRTTTSRRSFLVAVGAAGVATAGAAAVRSQPETTYRFGGQVQGWVGREPQAISDQTNPTIELQAGTQYEVVWENLDGAPHDFTILDSDGNEITGTETMSEKGATRSLTFTATEEMAQYICTVHPASMVGDIEVTGGAGQTPTATATPGGGERFVPMGPDIGLQQVADGPLVNPVGLHSVPGADDMRLVVDQMGQIYVHDADGLQEEPIFDISERLPVLAETEGGFERPEGFDERGLLGLAFHPDFEDNQKMYMRYSLPDEAAEDGLIGPAGREMPENWDHVEVLAEFQAAEDLSEIDPESERVLLEVPEPQFNHNSGDLAFGPDGYLYVGLGDGGDANDTGIGHDDVMDWYQGNEGGNGQDVEQNLLGSILRLDVDSQADDLPYGIPDDNPLVDEDGFDEHYAWGFRNPWRFSFNDGTLIVADVGQDLFEEVDVVEKGGNYGWNVKEGPFCFSTLNPGQPPEECPDSTPEDVRGGEPLIDPVFWYPHTFQGQPVGISVTGGYVYQGDAVPELEGQYVFGDWSMSFTAPRGRLFVGDVSDAAETGTPTETETETPTETATGTPTETETGTPTPGAGEETPTGTPTETEAEQPTVEAQGAEFEELTVAGGEDGSINRFVQSFARDVDGEVYVLASRTGRLEGTPGEVYKLVPAGEGDSISPPTTPTPGPGDEGEGEGEGQQGNETGTETGTPSG